MQAGPVSGKRRGSRKEDRRVHAVLAGSRGIVGVSEGVALVLKAALFASSRHGDQKRKGEGEIPYLNHPLEVAALLAGKARVDDPVLLAAALLHDTLEDTETTAEELEEHFGQIVRHIVEEVSDDKSLPRAVRREQQAEKALSYSRGAKLLRIADKISNLRDVIARPPREWTGEMKKEYVDWAEKVVANCRGTSESLERLFDETCAACREGRMPPG